MLKRLDSYKLHPIRNWDFMLIDGKVKIKVKQFILSLICTHLHTFVHTVESRLRGAICMPRLLRFL